MKTRNKIPCDRSFESSPMLFCEGYHFIQNRCKRYGTNIFQTRMLGQNVICMSGEEAGKLFYNEKYFIRKGAVPKMIQKTLFGLNGVQGLDGVEHKQRKLMFMSIMTPKNMELLKNITKNQWDAFAKNWEEKNNIILFDEVQELMTKIACEWAGVPLKSGEQKKRAKDLGKLVDGFGSIGIRHCQGRCARLCTEAWIRQVIKDIRTNRILPRKDSAAYIIAWHYDLKQVLLDAQIAAVELINIIRPITAIATYITFGALAMHEHPLYFRKLQSGDETYAKYFVQEVRRFYPFAPFVGARVRRNFKWNKYVFRKGTLVLYDLYGTNHDPKLYKKPELFYPERFLEKAENMFHFVPQGGGNPNTGHRCAGEMVTIQIMKDSLLYLATKLEYKVPKQNLSFNLKRIPTLPQSRFIIRNVKVKNSLNRL